MSDAHDHDGLTPTPAPPARTGDETNPAPASSHAHGHAHSHAHAHDHGPIDADLAESREGVRVLMISLVLLGITAIAQAIVVVYTGSVALLGDTVHNVGDALTALPLAAAFILSRRAPSKRFNYGLGRTEDLAGMLIVALIGFSGIYTLIVSVQRLINPEPLNYLTAGILAGILGFIGNEAVALYRIRQGRKMASAALIADGQHARVDGLLSLGVVAALLLYAAGFERADALMGIGISLVIARITWNSARDVGLRILDGIEPDEHDALVEAAGDVVPADQLVDVRARWLGHVIHAEVVIRGAVDPAWHGALEVTLRESSSRVRRVSLILAP